MVNYLQSCTGITNLEWLEVKTFSLFTTIMTTIDGERIELLMRQWWGECKVPCVVTSVYTTHVMHAKVSECFVSVGYL